MRLMLVVSGTSYVAEMTATLLQAQDESDLDSESAAPFSNPLATSFWQDATNQIIAIGAAEGIDVSHCATVSARIVDFLSYLESRKISRRQLTPIRWYRPFDFNTYHGNYTAESWRSCFPDMTLEQPGSVVLVPVDAVYHLKADGHDFILATPTQQVFWGSGIEDINPLMLCGSSESAVTGLLRDYYQSAHRRSSRINFWGAGMVGHEPQPVHEEELILDEILKRELLQYVDRFWRHQEFARSKGLPVRRGLLLAGHPGTGKTQFIRHIITRFQDARVQVMTPASDQSSVNIFPAMLAQAQSRKEPLIVIIEDLDRLFDQRGLTPQFFLNVLDGLLSVDAMILWVATTNDPAALKLNVLNRPGRFDRVVVFPQPGKPERAAMMNLFCQRDLSIDLLAEAVALSNGLSGAHIREACVSAQLAELDGVHEFSVLLIGEIKRIKVQHDATRRYDFELGEMKDRAGFNKASA
jgi:hypothetical protein